MSLLVPRLPFLEPPKKLSGFDGDSIKTLAAEALHSVLRGLLLFSFLYVCVVIPFFVVRKAAAGAMWAAIVVITLACMFLLRPGYVRLSSWIFLSTTWFFLSLFVTLSGGITSPALLSHIAVVVVAAWLVGRRAAVWVAVLSLSFDLGLAIIESLGVHWPRYFPVPPSVAWVIAAAVISLTIVPMAKVNQALADSAQQALRELEARRHEARAREESDERFRATFFQAAVGITQTDTNGRWLMVNDRLCEILGYSPAELREKTFLDITHPDDRESSLAAVRKLLAGEISAWSKEKRYIHKDGTTVWGRVFTSLVRDQHGKPQYFITVVEDINEKIEAERALRETERRLTLAQNAAYLGVWDRDLKTEIITICGKYAELHGLPPERTTLTHEEWFSLIHPDDRQRVQALMRDARERTLAFDGEFRVIWPDASVHWLWAKGTVLVDEARRPIRTMGVVGDMTERKHADDALRESEERFRNMADSAPVMIWVSSLGKHCTFFNKPWLDFTGHTMEQELGDGWAGGVHPADVNRCLATYNSSFDARRAFQMEYRLRRADGNYRWVLDNGAPLYRGGEFAGFIGSCIDITEQKLTEERLRESEQRLKSAERLTHVGNWHWDLQNNQISWSEEMFRIFGQPPDYLPSYDGFFQAVIPQDRERVARELSDALANKRGFSSEAQIIRTDGEQRTITFTAEMLVDEEGLLAGMFGATQDVTERKKNEAALLQSQESLRALTARLVDLQESGTRELARELHDDLCQNLAALGVEISALAPASAKLPRPFSEGIREARVRIMNLAHDVHAISRRLHPAILDELGLEAALRQECISFTERTGVPAQFEIEGVLEPLAKDVRLCFYRVAQESLHNIAKHARAAHVRMTLSVDEDRCTLRIEDDGQGFDPSSTKAKNALGLISMRERARLVNGNFIIKSQPGHGTTLEVSAGLKNV